MFLNGVIILTFIWYRTILLFITEFFEKRYPLYGKPFSVIIPVYNEEVDLLKKCLKSVYLADGDKEIFIVNDGSTSQETKSYLEELNRRLEHKSNKISVITLERNSGKREAHKAGFIKAKHDIIVVLDSDTVVDKNSFTELLRPFNDSLVGATTGEIKALNENETLVTKIQAARYWTGLNVDRKSQSFFGIVTCCSGALAAYRKKLVIDYLDEYTNQFFFGEKCDSGDDRYLTNLILRNWRVKYVGDAVAYTSVPRTFSKWIRQLLRWKRSFIRESLICLKNSWKKKKLLFFETLFNLVLPIFFVGVRFLFIVTIILYPYFLLLALPAMLLATLARDSHILVEKPKKMIYIFYYIFLYNFVLYWLYFVALFTFKNTKWGTR